MAVVRLQVELDRDTLVPEDITVNTWHITTQSNDLFDKTVETQLAITALAAFYAEVDEYLSAALFGTGRVKAYDLSEPEPRAPFINDPFPIAPGLTRQVGEVAICFSFQGAVVSGLPQRRRRGRIFLGPCAETAMQTVSGGVRIVAAARDDIATAGSNLLAASDGSAVWSWIVFSPTSAGPELGDGTFTDLPAGVVVVTDGWIDDAFDTIRSRGLKALARSTFS